MHSSLTRGHETAIICFKWVLLLLFIFFNLSWDSRQFNAGRLCIPSSACVPTISAWVNHFLFIVQSTNRLLWNLFRHLPNSKENKLPHCSCFSCVTWKDNPDLICRKREQLHNCAGRGQLRFGTCPPVGGKEPKPELCPRHHTFVHSTTHLHASPAPHLFQITINHQYKSDSLHTEHRTSETLLVTRVSVIVMMVVICGDVYTLVQVFNLVILAAKTPAKRAKTII